MILTMINAYRDVIKERDVTIEKLEMTHDNTKAN